MELVLDKDGHVVVRNGRPVYKDEQGQEVDFDAHGMTVSIARLKNENRQTRERAEAAEAKLTAFEGMDPAAARKALDTLKNLDDKKLIDSGKLDELKTELNKGWEAKLAAEKTERERIENKYREEKIGGAFARSSFISAKMNIPADVTQAFFGKHFKLEDGRVVAYDGNGQKVHSKSNPGELAEFDEALEILVTNYPNKQTILKGANGSGGGTPPGGGGGGGAGAKVKTRKEFEALSPVDQMKHVKDGGTVTDGAQT